jgi:hypothetical protein
VAEWTRSCTGSDSIKKMIWHLMSPQLADRRSGAKASSHSKEGDGGWPAPKEHRGNNWT